MDFWKEGNSPSGGHKGSIRKKVGDEDRKIEKKQTKGKKKGEGKRERDAVVRKKIPG